MAPPGYPLIVIGMHRSGTSLVARLLRRAGVHLGADLNDHDESDFFGALNRRCFQAAHAEWDWPQAMLPLLDDGPSCEALVAELGAVCASRAARPFLGWRRWLRGQQLADLSEPWGWKDPRSTCTLPLWLRIFPTARVVNVYRDGIDVAGSLVARERRRQGRLANAVRSSRCLDLERAFELWCEYVEASLRTTQELPPRRVRDVRYEALLEKPEERIRELLEFVGVPVPDEDLRALAAEVDPERGPARRREPELAELARAKADHPLLRRLEYGGDPWP